MSREYIANKLKNLRDSSGYTADQVGEMVGKSGKTVNAWENNRGQPDAEILMQLCDIYGVSDILAEFNPKNSENFILTEREKKVISAYRNNPSMQVAVDRLLNIGDEESQARIYRAAKSSNNAEDKIESVPQSRIDKLKNAPDDDKL